MLTTLQGGSGNGLELMLNVQQEEYLPVWGDTGETPPAWGDMGESTWVPGEYLSFWGHTGEHMPI